MSCCGSAPPLLWTLEPLSSFPAYANLCSKQNNNIIIITTITRKKQNKLYSTFCSKSKYSCVMQASRTSTKDRKDTLVNTAFMKAKNTTMPDDGRQRHDNSILPSYNIHSDEPVTGTLRLLRQLRAWCQWRVTCDVWIYQTRDVVTSYKPTMFRQTSRRDSRHRTRVHSTPQRDTYDHKTTSETQSESGLLLTANARSFWSTATAAWLTDPLREELKRW